MVKNISGSKFILLVAYYGVKVMTYCEKFLTLPCFRDMQINKSATIIAALFADIGKVTTVDANGELMRLFTSTFVYFYATAIRAGHLAVSTLSSEKVYGALFGGKLLGEECCGADFACHNSLVARNSDVYKYLITPSIIIHTYSLWPN